MQIINNCNSKMYCPRKIVSNENRYLQQNDSIIQFYQQKMKIFWHMFSFLSFSNKKNNFFPYPHICIVHFPSLHLKRKNIIEEYYLHPAICSKESNPLHLTLCHFYCSQNSESPHSKFKLVEHRVPENSKI